MSFPLPAAGSVARERMGDMEQIASLLSPEGRRTLPTFRDARQNAITLLSHELAARSVNTVCLRANGEIQLLEFGPKGGAKLLWNFGTGVASCSAPT